MKRWGIRILALVLISPLVFAQLNTYEANSLARLKYVSGDTYVQRAQDLGLEAGTVNLPVIAGDRLGTREGRLEIEFSGQNYLRMDRNTQVDVIQLPGRSQGLVRLNLVSGEIFLRISTLEQDQEIGIHTADASFYALEAGLYRLRIVGDQETELRVVEGSMEAAGETSSEEVGPLERLVASQGTFSFGPARLTARYQDSFTDWNRSRDLLLTRAVADSYLPTELSSYEAELAENGHWVYERPYGYVWVPHVYHSTWRPYYHGRWVWYPSWGYTWISFDPWGWCVSHYGRWQWRFGLGWYWIPQVGWGPGWVHWCHTSLHYGWLPLSYHGYPGVIYNNHYYGDRYYSNYIHNSRSLTLVSKRQLQNPNISRVALRANQLQGAGKVRLMTRQPAAGPDSAAGIARGAVRVPASSSRVSQIRNYSSRTSDPSLRTGNSRTALSPRASASRSAAESRRISVRSSRASTLGSGSRSSNASRTTIRSSRSSVSRNPSRSRSLRTSPSTSRNTRTVSRYPSRSSASSRRATTAPGSSTSRSTTSRSRQSSIRARTGGSASRTTRYPSRSTVRSPRSSGNSRSAVRSSRSTVRSYPNRSTTRSSRSSVSRIPSRSQSTRVAPRTSRSSSSSRGSVMRYSRPSSPSRSTIRSSRSSSIRSSVRSSRSSGASRSAVRSSRSSVSSRSGRRSSSAPARRSSSRSTSSRSSRSRVRKR